MLIFLAVGDVFKRQNPSKMEGFFSYRRISCLSFPARNTKGYPEISFGYHLGFRPCQHPMWTLGDRVQSPGGKIPVNPGRY